MTKNSYFLHNILPVLTIVILFTCIHLCMYIFSCPYTSLILFMVHILHIEILLWTEVEARKLSVRGEFMARKLSMQDEYYAHRLSVHV